MKKYLCLAGLLSVCASCTTFNENHFFKSVGGTSDRATNYYRLSVRGWSGWAGTRYVAGYYDERAVDLFFNELKTDTSANIPALFPSNLKNPGTEDKIVPLNPTTNGAFVMVFSTNANAVTDAIGAFAESQAVADAMTNLINRDTVRANREQGARLDASIGKASSVAAELDALIKAVPHNGSTAVLQEGYLRVLNSIARALNSDRNFATFDEAAQWFAGARSSF